MVLHICSSAPGVNCDTDRLVADSASGALDVLQSLLIAVPTFWGESEITQLVQTYIQACTDASHAESNYATPLMKAMAKRLPSKTLLPTLSKFWSTAVELSGPNVSVITCYHLL